jgi:hypothetical protein
MVSDKPQTKDLSFQDLILPTSRDPKNLGEHLEQARRSRRAVLIGQKIQSVLLGMAAGGLIIKLIEPKPTVIWGEMLIFCGGLWAALQTIRLLRPRRL